MGNAVGQVKLQRAAKYNRHAPAGVSVFEDCPEPTRFNDRQVKIKVLAAGVNPVDAKYIWGDKLCQCNCCEYCAIRLANGRIPGFDFAGIIDDAAETSKFKKGDEVFGILPPMKGSFAEYILAPEINVHFKPESLSFVEASALPLVGTTVTQMFSQHNLKSGDTLLVVGASGGVGHMATTVAHKKGIHVTGICGSRNEKFVKDLGAEKVICYDRDNIMGSLKERLSSDSHNGKMFDMCLDTVTSNEARDRASDYYTMIQEPRNLVQRDNHNYVTVGGQTFWWIIAGIKKIFGCNCFKRDQELFWIDPFNPQASLVELKDLADEKGLRPTIDSEEPFTSLGVQNAFEKLRNRRSVGKVVINMQFGEQKVNTESIEKQSPGIFQNTRSRTPKKSNL